MLSLLRQMTAHVGRFVLFLHHGPSGLGAHPACLEGDGNHAGKLRIARCSGCPIAAVCATPPRSLP